VEQLIKHPKVVFLVTAGGVVALVKHAAASIQWAYSYAQTPEGNAALLVLVVALCSATLAIVLARRK
jgi:hypothetical protein